MVGNESSADDIHGVSLHRPTVTASTGSNKWYYSHRFTTREQSVIATTTDYTSSSASTSNALVAEGGSASSLVSSNTSTVVLNPTHKRTHSARNNTNRDNTNRTNTTTISKTTTISTSAGATHPRNNTIANTSNSTTNQSSNNNMPIAQLTLQCLSCNNIADMVCQPCGHTFICYTCYTDLKDAPELENKIKSCPKCRFSLTSELPLIHIKFENTATTNSTTNNTYTLPTCRSYKGCDNTVYTVLSCGHMCYCEVCINKSVYTRCAECNTGFNQMSAQKIKFD